MTVPELRSIVREQPFRPFVIRLPNGSGLTVKHPEQIALAPNGRSCVVYRDDSSFTVVDVFSIEAVDIGPATGGQTAGHAALRCPAERGATAGRTRG